MNDRPSRNEDRLVYGGTDARDQDRSVHDNTDDRESTGDRNTGGGVSVPPQRADEVTPEFREPRHEGAPLAHRAEEPPGHASGGDPLDPAYQADPAHRAAWPASADAVAADPEPVAAGQAVRPGTAHTAAVPGLREPLFDQDSEEVRRRWQEVQASFVDDPRDSVERADSLVTEITDSLRAALEARTSGLQDRWKNGDRHDTEDLRTALRDYRALLEQLLDLSAGKR
ncbi:hypothetical protein [Streptosporangium sp. NPDC051022]|uniref:hypothetical protein n=1 Tax=Streptosporangium sp. NPDC051022 TaxID=3155752 RepID=UPI0034426584